MAAWKIGNALIVGLCLLSLGPAVPVAFSQTSLGTLRGAVADQQGGVLPGATITARHVATNTIQSTVSGEQISHGAANEIQTMASRAETIA